MDVIGVPDTWDMIMERAFAKKVSFLPGQAFSPVKAPSSKLRASYSLVSEKEMDVAFQKLAELIIEEIQIGQAKFHQRKCPDS